jgi:hypothetical protein
MASFSFSLNKQSPGISILEPAANPLDEKDKTGGQPNKNQRQIFGGHAQSLGRI